MKIRLNLGCGDHYVDGWVNVDHDSPHRKDVDVDLNGELPWIQGSISQVYAGHLLEHLTIEQCATLLARLLPCMRPDGGTMVAVGPDVEIAERMVADGTFDHSWGTLDMLKHGAGRWSGDVHRWETTGGRVLRLFIDTGWPTSRHLTIDQLEDDWPVADREPKWQYAVRACVGEP